MSEAGRGCPLCAAPPSRGELKDRRCGVCGAWHAGDACCEAGHFVCDGCRALEALDLIERTCAGSDSRNPVTLAQALLRCRAVPLHGPEHHFLVPAVLLTAWCNVREEPERKARLLRQARERAAALPEGACGFWGTCAAASGAGIFVSLATGATPLSHKEWRLANQTTARALTAIADKGGPRCCKRSVFHALQAAVELARVELDANLEAPLELLCEHHEANAECHLARCPFFPRYAPGALNGG